MHASPTLLLVLAGLVTTTTVSAQQNDVASSCPPESDILPCRCTMRGDDLQIWCSHSDLGKVMGGLQAVGKMLTRSVDELILENNFLPSLPGRAFSSLRVTRLMLRDNGLERVATSWLAGLEDSLLELFIVEPRLRSLPADSLEQLRGLEAVTLQGGVMKRVPRFSGLTRMRYLQIQSPALIELSPLAFRALPDLEQIHVVHSPHVTRLEAGLLHDLPRLRLINVSHCGLTWVHPRALARLPSLAELSLPGNRLVDAGMVGRSARDLPALAVLRLDDNHIDRLAEASFVDMPTLREVTLTGNRVTELQRGAFHRVPALRKLELSRNRIRRVHPEAFLQGSDGGIEELWLTDNALGHAGELRALLDGLPRLRYLDASRNYIEDIPFGALRGHPTLERLHLDHNRIQRVQREAFTAMPALRELRMRNNSLSSFTDAPFWNLPALKGLDLSYNYFRRLDGRLLDNLPSLRRLDMSGNAINEVDAGTFLGTPAIEHVNLSGNALVSLHPVTFRNLVNLYEVDVGWNRLRELVPGLPKRLEYLHMPHNQITSLPPPMSPDMSLPSLRLLDLTGNGLQRLPPGALGGLPQLRWLHLGENALHELDEGALGGLSRLEMLDLRDNRLLRVHGRTLRDASQQLRTLDLRGNRLESLPTELLRGCEHLLRLDVSRNQLGALPAGALVDTRGLEELDASRNSLSAFPEALSGLSALHTLDLSHNLLMTLPTGTLTSLSMLSELRLARNRLQELPEGTFRDLPRLKLLDLDSNELHRVSRGALNALPELQAIRLGRNRLVTLPEAAFLDLPLLQSAELQHNQLADIAAKTFQSVPQLLLLNLSHNALTALDQAGLQGLRSLEVLDLSHNRLAKVGGDSLASMEWLVELKMDNNRICAIQGAPFNGMPRLRVLSLKNNRMTTLAEPVFTRLRSNIAVLDVAGNPLACSCGIVWLQAWLQDIPDREGPHCADGSLLMEARLSRQNCQNSRQAEPEQGCDAELVGGSSVLGTSQILSTWMEVKDSTPTPQIAPSPEESEYFYDEYVEYQYDDANSTASTNTSVPMVASQASIPAGIINTPQSPTTTLSPHYISGDTPTFYAGSRRDRNKTQNYIEPLKIPQPIPPNAGGLTFFGIPLPSLNIGGLWGTSRKSDAKPGDVRFVGARGKVHMLPPPDPQVHSGGFVPMLPESGGFMPIVNPQLLQQEKHNQTRGSHLSAQHHLKVNYSSWDHPGGNRTVQLSNTTSLSSYGQNSMEPPHSHTYTHRGPGMMPPLPSQSSDFNHRSMSTQHTTPPSNSIPHQANFLDPQALHTNHPRPTSGTGKHSTSDKPNGMSHWPMSSHRQASDHNHTTPEAPPKPSSSMVPLTANELGHMLLPQMIHPNFLHLPNIETELVSTARGKTDGMSDTTVYSNIVNANAYNETTTPKALTPSPEGDGWGFHWLSKPAAANSDVMEATVIPVTDTTTMSVVGIISSNGNGSGRNLQPPSSLSALLVPGGQQPQVRQPAGRPTITKVVSPPGSEPVEEYLRGPEPNSNPVLNTDIPQNTSMEWYFKNYNRTNLTPYIGPSKKASSGQDIQTSVSISILLLVFIHLAVF